MGAYYGINTTAKYAGGLANKMAAGLIDGRVKVWSETLACTSAITSGSTIQIAGYGSTGYLPKGATILAIIIGCNVAQTSLTLSVGNGYSATQFASAVTNATAGVAIVHPGCGYVVGTQSLDNYILLTTGGASMQTTGTLSIQILYTTD